jgi:hypothetical protein
MFHIGDFARGLETVYEPEVVADVKKRLHEAAAELGGGSFRNVRVSESVFGASPAGSELGSAHGSAHRVIADTIEGVVVDLRDFQAGVEQAEQMLVTADDGAASDLNSKAAVTGLLAANRHFAADAYNQRSRNENLAGGEDA